MTLPLTAAGLGVFLLALQTLLMLSVGMHRFRTATGVGHAEDMELERKVRRHGNLAENAALFLVVLALAEMAGAPSQAVFGFAAAFALARVSHMLGFASLSGSHDASRTTVFLALRSMGSFGTVFAALGLAGYLAYLLAGA